jgi:hypothetical protein
MSIPRLVNLVWERLMLSYTGLRNLNIPDQDGGRLSVGGGHFGRPCDLGLGGNSGDIIPIAAEVERAVSESKL